MLPSPVEEFADLADALVNFWHIYLGLVGFVFLFIPPNKRYRWAQQLAGHGTALARSAARPFYCLFLFVMCVGPVVGAVAYTNQPMNQLIIGGLTMPVGLWFWWQGKDCDLARSDDCTELAMVLLIWVGMLGGITYAANV